MAQHPRLTWKLESITRDLRHVWNGNLIVYEKPVRNATYVLGVDVGQGRGKDRSVVQVLRVGTLKQRDAQVAEFASDTLQPKGFAEVIASIGRLYHGEESEALVIVERNTAGGGDLTLEDLRFRWDYGNLYAQKNLDSTTNIWSSTLGWHTGQTNRPKLILAAKEAIENGYVEINSPLLLAEMETFEGDSLIARAQAASGQFDDRVMAFSLAHWAAHEEEWLLGEDISRTRARLNPDSPTPLTMSGTSIENDSVARVDFQNTDASLDDYNDYGDGLAGQYGWN